MRIAYDAPGSGEGEMDLAELEVLVAVAQEKGFSRAAHRLHRTQPSFTAAQET